MKNKIVAIIVFLVIVLSLSFIIYTMNSKIYLSDKYYNKGEYIEIKNNDLKRLGKENYLLFTYNSYCTFKVPCENIFKETMNKYKIDILSMPIEEFKKIDYYKKVKYAPSVMVIKKGRIKAYLDPNSNDDLNRYQNSTEFEKWLDNYIYLKK